MATTQGQQAAKQQMQTGNNKPAETAATTGTEKTKSERFKEIAPKRTRGILKALDILGNCGNRSGYEYTQENIDKIFSAIEKKVEETKAKFQPKAATAKDVSFEL